MGKTSKEVDQTLVEALTKMGFPFTAKYIEKYGSDNMNPSFWGKPNKKTEAFYKTCIEEGHPWDYYMEAPPEGALL